MSNYVGKHKGKMDWLSGKAIILCLLASFLLVSPTVAVSPPTISDYTAVPHFIDESVKPNILILLDNSGSMLEYAYAGRAYNPDRVYYGYFGVDRDGKNHVRYNHSSNLWTPHENGEWCGNFLNFLTMRRTDLMRKVVGGGQARGQTGTGAMELVAEQSTGDTRWKHEYTHDSTDGPVVSPHIGEYTYYIGDNDEIVVTGVGFTKTYSTIRVKKDPAFDPPSDFYEYDDGTIRLGGVLQQFGRDANWGNMWFHEGRSPSRQGGYIANPVGSVVQFSSLITDLMKEPSNTWTPLAESYYVAMQHFKQENIPSSLGYLSQAAKANDDPFEDSEWCAKNFVLILSDGASTQDAVIPNYLKDYADDKSPSFFLEDKDGSGYTNSSGRYDSGGTDFLKDIAYYARTNNLRDDIDGHTHLIPYFVFAFEDPVAADGEPNQGYLDARELMMEAARQGGWRRQINDNIPGLNSDNTLAKGYEKEDLVPDNYFEAQDGHDLEDALRRAMLSMLNRAASGTAASVVTPTGRSRGEGSVIHSYFQPVRSGDTLEISMAGHLHSLWIDPWGNLRENSTNDLKLDFETDKIVKFEYVSRDEGTLAKRFQPFDPFKPVYDENGKLICPGYDPDNPIEIPDSPFNPYFEMHDLESLFDAGEVLWRQTAESRNIYTFKEGAIGNRMDFQYAEGDKDIIPYLGVNNASVASSYISSLGRLGADVSERAETLIDYIRGIDKPGLRNRTLDINGVSHVWKLGTIVNSTPSVVGGATGRYDISFRDPSYRQYRREVRDREVMVYVGANDGMLHAFTHGNYDALNMTYSTVEEDELGTEVWAYIPKVLLPHLKWLADPSYVHVYYADLQPRIFDAKIRNGGDEWGTFLLLGLNMGGKRIYINKEGEDKVIYPSYTLIDITEPRNPKVMWERSYDGSGLTTSLPAVFKVGEEWFAAFGSGPNDDSGKSDYEGRSDQKSKIYIIDLATGDPHKSGTNEWFKELDTELSFMNSPVAFDKNINNNADGIYFAETYLDNPGHTHEAWKGKIHKITVDVDEEFNYDASPGSWSHSMIFESPGPVTARISMRSDLDDNVMLYFGTGRYMEPDDATDSKQQYLFGIKDPLYDINNSTSTVSFNKLFKANPIDVTDMGYVYEGASLFDRTGNEDDIKYSDTFEEMVAYVRNNYQGWYRELETFGSGDLFASERIISIPSLIGRMIAVSTFVPIDDICEAQGDSNMLAVYYQTGTGYTAHVLPEENSIRNTDWGAVTAVRFIIDKPGMPASHMTVHRGGSDRPVILLEADALGGLGDVDATFEMEQSRITGWRDR